MNLFLPMTPATTGPTSMPIRSWIAPIGSTALSMARRTPEAELKHEWQDETQRQLAGSEEPVPPGPGEHDEVDDRDDLVGERDRGGQVQAEGPVRRDPHHGEGGDEHGREDQRLLPEGLVAESVGSTPTSRGARLGSASLRDATLPRAPVIPARPGGAMACAYDRAIRTVSPRLMRPGDSTAAITPKQRALRRPIAVRFPGCAGRSAVPMLTMTQRGDAMVTRRVAVPISSRRPIHVSSRNGSSVSTRMFARNRAGSTGWFRSRPIASTDAEPTRLIGPSSKWLSAVSLETVTGRPRWRLSSPMVWAASIRDLVPSGNVSTTQPSCSRARRESNPGTAAKRRVSLPLPILPSAVLTDHRRSPTHPRSSMSRWAQCSPSIDFTGNLCRDLTVDGTRPAGVRGCSRRGRGTTHHVPDRAAR